MSTHMEELFPMPDNPDKVRRDRKVYTDGFRAYIAVEAVRAVS